MFTLVVSLLVEPGKERQFLAAIEANAAASRREEPGCRRFDVVRDNADPHHYLLYELYDDERAFQAHKDTAHYARWRQAAAECLADQVNTAATLVFSTD